MSKVDVKVVVGSNYGDEGKGMATHFFSHNAKKQLCLNVLYNGGCQRGHTVELKNGKRHIFHHFGSGTYSKAHTFFDKDFMVNPMVFIDELNQLQTEDKVTPVCIASPKCRVTTPYDMFINQIIETARDKNRHGSCGYGIWETQKRYEDGQYALFFGELMDKTNDEILKYLNGIAHDYLPKRLKYYGITKIPDEYKKLIDSPGLAEHYLIDLREMQRIVRIATFKRIREWYGTIVFEGAQGLALDENNVAAFPYVTASKTTSLIPIERVSDMDANIEVCYITRSYFTKHGAGFFSTECAKNKINANIEDRTNIRNDYQEEIRYGMFDITEFLSRVQNDMKSSKAIRPDLKTSVFITHLNYTNDIAGNCSLQDLKQYFDYTYKSYTKFIEDIKEND